MNAATIFARISGLWPQSVDISTAQRNASGELWFPELASINQNVETKLDFATDHWGNLGAWSLYQSLVEISRERYKQGEFILSPVETQMSIFDKWMRAKLDHDTFEEERLQYRGL